LARVYALALELLKEASLRSIEATDRFGRLSLTGLKREKAQISILGMGWRIRTALISADLYRRLESHFHRSQAAALAPPPGLLNRAAACGSAGRRDIDGKSRAAAHVGGQGEGRKV